MAYDMIELPDPYRSDWRFAYLATTIINVFAKKDTQVKIQDVYKDMLQFYSVLPVEQEVDDDMIKATLMACLPALNKK